MSIRGFPGRWILVLKSDAEEVMKEAGLNLNLDTEESMRLLVSPKLAKYYGFKLVKLDSNNPPVEGTNAWLSVQATKDDEISQETGKEKLSPYFKSLVSLSESSVESISKKIEGDYKSEAYKYSLNNDGIKTFWVFLKDYFREEGKIFPSKQIQDIITIYLKGRFGNLPEKDKKLIFYWVTVFWTRYDYLGFSLTVGTTIFNPKNYKSTIELLLKE